MSSSLRDQLLKAGLVNEKQIRQAEKQRRKQPPTPAEAAAQKRAAQQAHASKTARDQELNRRKAARAEAKAREAQVRQLVEQNRLPKSDSDDYYCFQDGTHVRRIALDAGQRAQLVSGDLAIARYGRAYALVPAAAAGRIRERDPRAIVDRVDRETPDSDARKDENDPYKGFEVPDDLMW